MPDGFEPHTELAKIFTLRELMTSCRQRMPVVLDVLDDALMHPEIGVRLQAAEICMNRGFGKPRQHVDFGLTDQTQTKRVIVLPDNHRNDQIQGPVIDADT